MKRPFLPMLAIAAFLIALTHPAGGRDVPRDRTLRINLGAEPQTLDPSLATDLVGSVVFSALMEGLVDVDENENPIPRLATRWSSNDDYTSWTFHLRDDARWHNGDPVTAHDFVYGIRRLLTPSTGAQYASYAYSFLEGGEEWYRAGGMAGGGEFNAVRAIDDHTLVYHLAHPTPHFPSVLQLFTWLPLHRPTIEAHGDRWATTPETFTGNGPYRLTTNQFGQMSAGRKATTHHSAGGLHWERVEFHYIQSETTANTAFLRGDIDVSITVPLPEIDYWRGRPEFSLKNVFGTLFLIYNTEVEPFDDARVRRALNMTINRRLLTAQVTRRNEPVSEGLVPRGFPSAKGGDYRDHAGNLIGPRDVETARALLADAGYPEGRGFPSAAYLFETSEQQRMLAEQIQAMWRRALNIDVRLQNVEWGVLLSRTRQGDFQLARLGWYGDYLDPMSFLELFTSDNPQNRPGYRNPDYDGLIDRARHEANPERREELMAEAERLLIERDAVVCPLFTYSVPTLARADLEGIGRTMTGSLIWLHSRPRE